MNSLYFCTVSPTMQGDFRVFGEFRKKYLSRGGKRGGARAFQALVEGMIETFAKGGYNLRLTFPHPS
ncbi:hypothetical protein [Janthinobacterium sp. ZB1P44]|uniref:hypothetical protein n=1 Tax=Janthinobacterium sp. ZB1P44 TaxID=3424192 RepID=UPI003F25E3EB